MIDKENKNHNPAPYRAFIIIFTAVLIVAGVSLLPLSDYTNGIFKDFDLLGDVRGENDSTSAESDGLLAKSSIPDSVLIAEQPAMVNGKMQIEDYSHEQKGMSRLRNALADTTRVTRIAVLGDSYIEGDILTQDLRDQLQSVLGGSGVGYMNMFTAFSEFRKSVKQSGEGWLEHSAKRKDGEAQYLTISEQYFMPSGRAVTTYKGSKAFENTARWERSKMLFIAPAGGTIETSPDGETWTSHAITPSKDVQSLTIDAVTDQFSVRTSTPSLVALGCWLDSKKGVSVDCMSSRGLNGSQLAKVDSALIQRMRKHIDYDLIVLEFGINAMSAKQNDYSAYGRQMEKVVTHLKNCYPNADILIMGVGDRGEKQGSIVKSMACGANMVATQRNLARKGHVFFFDTRQAMGGDGAIAEWVKLGYSNKDYIHLTHKGGRELASKLSQAILNNINR